MSKRKNKEFPESKFIAPINKAACLQVLQNFNVQRNGYTFIYKKGQLVEGEQVAFLLAVQSPVVEI